MGKASNKIIDAVMMFRLYESGTCWKVNTTVVANNLINLASDVAKREAFKTNISIREKGFGWKELHITWTHQRVKRHLVELDNQSRKIIRYENKNGIPTEPLAKIPIRTHMPILGTMTDDRRILDQKHLDTEKKYAKGGQKYIRR